MKRSPTQRKFSHRDVELLQQAQASLENALNQQAVFLRVFGRLFGDLGVSQTLVRRLYILEAVALLGGVDRKSARGIVEGRKGDLTHLIGKFDTEEVLGMVAGGFDEQDQAEEKANAQHPEEAIIFSAGN